MLNSVNPMQNGGESLKFDAMGWTFYGVEGAKRSLIDFDLSALAGNYGIMDARLSLYFYTDEPTYVPHSGDNGAYIRMITSVWEEDQVTWSTMPQTTSEGQVWLPPSTDPEQDYLDIDVTGLVRQRYHDPENTFGFMLQLADEIPYRSLMFSSGDNVDSTLWPKLVITYCLRPEADFQYNANDLYVEFTDQSSSADSWWWDFGDGYFSYMKNPTHVYPVYGTFNAWLTVTDSCGASTVTRSIVLSPSGMEEYGERALKLWPCPASDIVNVALPAPGVYELTLTDTHGREMLKDIVKNDHQNTCSVNIERCPSGIYMVSINSAKGIVRSRLVINH